MGCKVSISKKNKYKQNKKKEAPQKVEQQKGQIQKKSQDDKEEDQEFQNYLKYRKSKEQKIDQEENDYTDQVLDIYDSYRGQRQGIQCGRTKNIQCQPTEDMQYGPHNNQQQYDDKVHLRPRLDNSLSFNSIETSHLQLSSILQVSSRFEASNYRNSEAYTFHQNIIKNSSTSAQNSQVEYKGSEVIPKNQKFQTPKAFTSFKQPRIAIKL